MGRYYHGDIEGKFWYGVQSSNDAEFFGVKDYPRWLNYYFLEESMEDIESGIQKCLEALGEYKDKLDKFFEGDTTYYEGSTIYSTGDARYSKDCMADTLFGKENAKDAIDSSRLENVLKWYARLKLGVKIRDCVKENGSCSFTAEV